MRHLHHLHWLHVLHERRLAAEAQPIARSIPPPPPTVSPPVQHSWGSGIYSCNDLERLWVSAGGNPGAAFMAAEIAMAESGGNPNAISPTADYGLWQINISNGSLATLDPLDNARSAIILSDNGTNWDAWTTYTHGLYYGRCLDEVPCRILLVPARLYFRLYRSIEVLARRDI